MRKTPIYIVQIMGIIAILCGYFLSDQPDSLSQMHFNPDPSCLPAFSKATRTADNNTAAGQVFSSSQNNPTRKSSVPKFISYEVVLSCKDVYRFHPRVSIVYAFPIRENYAHLFYEEINPPPPKVC